VEVQADLASGAITTAADFLTLPFVLLKWMDPTASDVHEEDNGWMIRPSASSGEEGVRICSELAVAAADGRFLVWIADSF
jgi:hypothetical protein